MGYSNNRISQLLVDFIVWISPLIAAITKSDSSQPFGVGRVYLDQGFGSGGNCTDGNLDNADKPANDAYTFGFFSVILVGAVLTVLRTVNLFRVKGGHIRSEDEEKHCCRDCTKGGVYYCKVNCFCGDRMDSFGENNQLYYLIMVSILSPAQTVALFLKPCNNASFGVFVALMATSLELLASSEPILADMVAKKLDNGVVRRGYWLRALTTILCVGTAFVTQFVNLGKVAIETDANVGFWIFYLVYLIIFVIVLLPSLLFSFCGDPNDDNSSWKAAGEVIFGFCEGVATVCCCAFDWLYEKTGQCSCFNYMYFAFYPDVSGVFQQRGAAKTRELDV